MGDVSLLDALGIATMLGGGSDSVLSASADDLMDPGGYMRSQGLDPYGRPLASNSPNLAGTKKPGIASKGVSKLKSLQKGYEAGINPLVQKQTQALTGLIPQGPLPAKGGHMMKAGRMAGQALKGSVAQTALKYAPLVGTALSVGDLVLGDESLANKGMDAAFMAGGAALGSVVPVVGTGIGATLGKMASDATQFVVGGGKSAEQRKMEEALAALRGGQI